MGRRWNYWISIISRSMFPLIFLYIILSSIASSYVHSPRTFQTGDPLRIEVSKLWSTKAQLSYDFDYCKAQDVVDNVAEKGCDPIYNSMQFNMHEDQPRMVACSINLDAESSIKFKEIIDDEYRVHMILDNLPLIRRRSRRRRNADDNSTTVEHGFHVGFKLNVKETKQEMYFINNHLSFTVLYHREPETNYARIVGFEVTPSSITHKEWDENLQLALGSQNTEVGYGLLPQVVENDRKVVFSYSVSFKESDIVWASRWDSYLLLSESDNHWLFVIKSVVVVFWLTGFVAMIMLKTVHRDFAKENQVQIEEEVLEETGWKMIHGDVFRVPESPGFLCVCIGSGVQILATTLATIMCGLLGFLSPIDLSGCMTAMVVVWIFMGLFAGYSSARLYKMLKGKHPKAVALCTSFFVSGVLFVAFFTSNSLIRDEKSPRTVPSGTVFAFVCLWFGVSVPLVFLGSYLGFRRPPIKNPVKNNRIPSQVPYQPWYMRPVISALIGGSITFSAISFELYFILTSIWLNRFYYNFFFIFLLFVVLVTTCAGVTVILCYYQLCSEDYNWWWRAYNTAGSSALYLFLGSIYYFFTKLRITKLVPSIMYFVYMSAASYAFYVLMGTTGFYACLWFVQKIYSSVKIN